MQKKNYTITITKESAQKRKHLEHNRNSINQVIITVKTRSQNYVEFESTNN